MRITVITLAILIIFSNSAIYAKDTQPKGLKAVTSDNVVYLNWSKPKKSVKGFWVYRAMPEGEYQRINTILLKKNFYKDTKVVNGQLYWYAVTAIDKEALQSQPTYFLTYNTDDFKNLGDLTLKTPDEIV